MRHLSLALALTASVFCLQGCGSSPSEPNETPLARTTLKITVTECSLGGSVVVIADGIGNEPVTLSTPGEVTLMLTPGPHSLTYQRGNHVLGGSVIGTPDALSAIPIGGTAAITFVNPPAACMTVPEH